ncbi:MAG TPA: phosphatidate cytidylyltransferase [Gaiellaceae bacterium]|jgi:phosphatidate cytidylyltransferase|nr:phosphatidate cytidylyltransferase [Gaiellaceae bacterium]
MSPLVSRVVVAVVALPVVFFGIWAGGWWLVGLLTVAAMMALHEFYELARELRPVLLAGYAGTLAALVGAAWGPEWVLAGFFSTLPLVFLFKAAGGGMPSIASSSVTVFGAAWIGVGLAHLVLIREIPEHGALTLFTVVLAVFASDTAAYAAGRLIGRHKMAPQTSPGKTWEGFAAGSVAAVLVPFFAFYEEEFLTVPESLAVGVAIAVAGPVGDLFESAVKRDAGVKDSGRLLLGHGGILDRLDAFLFTGAAVYYLLVAFGAA